jgi:hypothetical protein
MKKLSLIMVLLISTTAIAADWTDTLSVKGDFRLRHEMIDKDGSKIRNRERFRMRLGMTAKVNEDINVNFGIASGGDDPISTNQTIGSGFSSKSVVIDIASFDYAIAEGIGFTGGKMKNPFFRPAKSELIWDGDLRPEGVSFNYKSDLFFANSGAFQIEERSSLTNSAMYQVQAGTRLNLGSAKLIIGAGMFNYSVLDSNYCELYELFGELSTPTSLTLFFDYVTNSDADEKNEAFQYGVKYGKAKKVGSWSARVLYKEVEVNSVYADFTDSDFAGGGTGGKGYEANLGYMFAENAKFGLTYFMNEMIEDGQKYNRLQADIKLKF